MRAVFVAMFIIVVGPGWTGCEIKWPNSEVQVPPLVQKFIATECLDHFGAAGSEWDACVNAEQAGYRATVMMLTDPTIGAKAAERYRACAAGHWAQVGRFHRHKASCIGSAFQYVWRFESTSRA